MTVNLNASSKKSTLFSALKLPGSLFCSGHDNNDEHNGVPCCHFVDACRVATEHSLSFKKIGQFAIRNLLQLIVLSERTNTHRIHRVSDIGHKAKS